MSHAFFNAWRRTRDGRTDRLLPLLRSDCVAGVRTIPSTPPPSARRCMVGYVLFIGRIVHKQYAAVNGFNKDKRLNRRVVFM